MNQETLKQLVHYFLQSINIKDLLLNLQLKYLFKWIWIMELIDIFTEQYVSIYIKQSDSQMKNFANSYLLFLKLLSKWCK